MEWAAAFCASTLSAGTLLALAALGLVVNEKAGVVNLSVEGLMLCSALVGFAVTVETQSFTLGFLLAALVGATIAGVLAILTVGLNTNQYATGLALGLFGVGFSAFAGTSYVQAKLPARPEFALPWLSDLPFFGPALFKQHPLVYAAFILAGAMVWFFYRSRRGLELRAVGESPMSAHTLGYSVRGIRLAALLFGGAMCGLAGAYLSLVYTGLWVENMTAGRGWIALALTTFATWRPLRVLLGAMLFGGVTLLSFNLQSQGVQIPSEILSMLPYLATIFVLALISYNPAWIRANMPAALGKPFMV